MKPLHIVVLGATGRSGLAVIKEALERGHRVTALARSPENLAVDHERLSVAYADMLKPETLLSAMPDDADAVVSALGLFPRKPSTELSEGTAQVIAAMQAKNLHRLVLISSFGCGGTDQQAPFFLRLFAFKFLFRHTIPDKERQEHLVREAGLAYTILRPTGLEDGEPQGETLTWEADKPAGVKRFKTSRGELARLCLDCVADDSTIGRTLMVSE